MQKSRYTFIFRLNVVDVVDICVREIYSCAEGSDIFPLDGDGRRESAELLIMSYLSKS
jgi:hypothetical protein